MTTNRIPRHCEDCEDAPVFFSYEDCGCMTGLIYLCIRCTAAYEPMSDAGLCCPPVVRFV